MKHDHPSTRRLGGPGIAGLACVALLAACSKSPPPAEPAAAPPAPDAAVTTPDASALAPSATPEAMTPAAL